jgi:uncharacterized protein YwgA
LPDKQRVLACLKALGFQPSMKTFSDRKKMQKLAYLMQEVFGIDLRCHFSWYIHGPYAPDLTRMLFEVAERSVSTHVEAADKSDLPKIEKMKAFLGSSINSVDKLELLGSLDYLRKLGKLQAVNDLEIIAVLKEKKPYFKDKDIAWAWQKLERE